MELSVEDGQARSLLTVEEPPVDRIGVNVPEWPAGGVLAFIASLVTGLWHQRLRNRTGLPVVHLLDEAHEPFAAMMRAYREEYELVLQEDPAELSHEEMQNLRELQNAARQAMTAQTQDHAGTQPAVHHAL